MEHALSQTKNLALEASIPVSCRGPVMWLKRAEKASVNWLEKKSTAPPRSFSFGPTLSCARIDWNHVVFLFLILQRIDACKAYPFFGQERDKKGRKKETMNGSDDYSISHEEKTGC